MRTVTVEAATGGRPDGPNRLAGTTGAGGPELRAALRRAGVGDLDDSSLTRSLYSSDASLYRVEPRVVVHPRDAGEVLAVLDVARGLSVPVTSRGAGTSLAGNAVGSGIILDFYRHMNRLLDVDPEAGIATVEPGIVQAALQRAVIPAGWRFGPDPSTHNRCTIGGMIGNNACGSRALGYGRTADNVLGLDFLTGAGERFTCGGLATPGMTATLGAPGAPGAPGASALPGAPGSSGVSGEPRLVGELRELIGESLAVVRTELGRFGRQVSGYSLEHLLPERHFDLARALVGSEGTLGIVLAAQLRLVRDPAHRILVALGYPDMPTAADAVPAILPFGPVACEGLDVSIVDVVRRGRGASSVPPLPRGDGWLFVELAGDDPGALGETARALAAEAGALEHRMITDAAQMARLWRIREDGSGLVARTADGTPAHAGWEDAAVPPERLGGYLREFRALLTDHGLTGVPYGHFGDGCVHIRIDFPFDRSDGRARFREFLFAAARLAATHGGSMSGEHGDGRARGELLPLMYSPAAIELFGRVKALFDPDNLLNPGVIVDPAPVDADIRVAAAKPRRHGLALTYHDDRGDLSMAVHRCTGVGRCIAGPAGAGNVMCPSYLATREEKDSTRGRARVLQDAVAGNLGPAGLAAPEVHEALDLCLSCKGCASDCPTGVDMASYKAEALYQKYRHRLRPRAHYLLGWLPRWLRLAAAVPGAAGVLNTVAGWGWARPLVAWLVGVDRRRELPRLATRTFRSSVRSSVRRTPPAPPARTDAGEAGRLGEVVLFVDTFSNHFSPPAAHAAVEVLERAGWAVRLPERQVCCGLTWFSTGQLPGARRQMARTVAELLPHVRAGRLVVGVEPSCTAALRTDAVELLATPEAREVADAVRTLAELLESTPDYRPPSLASMGPLIAQPHCHHHAVLGWSPDARLLADAGADVQQLGGCCGLAGNFGVERGHHDISVQVAEQQLLPAVRAKPEATVLADGFSCRTQLDSLTGRHGVHLAELLVAALRADDGTGPA
ncbi:FAD-binding and (Fe-S)-binding domain-containing protein [Frankia sp. CcI49]|uniref:FAD-binding and (Fe-S)-binding domain-containing protein n=1 Tax=Frankia sp. CcI49 TaxID=1745382 RepID=UPI000A06750E|nr:FAD-binding and (Fe-S)-binding domain-containing protein [Frankia sp. CcI49]